MTHPAGTSLDRQPPPGKQWHDLVKQGTANSAKVPGTCVVCGCALYGWSPDPHRKACGNNHCQIEAKRKHPCKFKRLRNERLT